MIETSLAIYLFTSDGTVVKAGPKLATTPLARCDWESQAYRRPGSKGWCPLDNSTMSRTLMFLNWMVYIMFSLGRITRLANEFVNFSGHWSHKVLSTVFTLVVHQMERPHHQHKHCIEGMRRCQ